MRYLVNYGNGNVIESNSRNARKLVRDLGYDVYITTKTGKFVCKTFTYADGTVVVTTED